MTPTQHEINDWLDYMVETRSHEIINKLPHAPLVSIQELKELGGYSSLRKRNLVELIKLEIGYEDCWSIADALWFREERLREGAVQYKWDISRDMLSDAWNLSEINDRYFRWANKIKDYEME